MVVVGVNGVQEILSDAELRGAAGAFVVAAPDPVGSWGAVELLRKQYGIAVTVLTGPTTDNEVGLNYIQSALGLPAHNARRDAKGLLSVVLAALAPKLAPATSDRDARSDRLALELQG